MSDTVQAAACVGCGESWVMPDALPPGFEDRYPLASGVWEEPCPACGGPIWLTEPMPREDFDAMKGMADRMLAAELSKPAGAA